jgi:integrase
VDGVAAGCELIELGEFGGRGGEADVEAFDLAEPVLLLGFGDSVAEVVADLDEARFRPLLVLIATTGLRRGEALGLRWADVDIDGGALRVSHALVRSFRGLDADNEPKTPRGRRTLPLAPATVGRRREHRRRQLVFTTVAGGALEPRNVSRWYSKLATGCGVQDRGDARATPPRGYRDAGVRRQRPHGGRRPRPL